MDKVKEHFEEEAARFDKLVLDVIPFYKNMLEALVSTIPFKKDKPIRVMDIGSGTGTLAELIKKRYPKARITCLDLAENMIKIAKNKLKEHKGIKYILGNCCEENFKTDYDVIVSSLTLHHINTEKQKKEFYKKVLKHLSANGVFYNADIILATGRTMQETYMAKWKEQMCKSLTPEDVENIWILKYKSEDHPFKLMEELSWIKAAGFKDVDVVWKYYNFAVYGGTK